MTDPHDGPTIPARFQKYPDARNDEYHSAGIIYGFLACLAFIACLIGWGLLVWWAK